ncbi:MAG: ABC transporter ATP-binding protein [Pseudomonadota bacterium]
MGDPIVVVDGLTKTYGSGLTALSNVSLSINEGEILALLGPNGAGKTTLISIICGLVSPSGGTVTVAGHDVVRAYRKARKMIGLVPQEIVLEPFETVIDTVRYSRGLFGLGPDPAYVESLLRRLTLWDKRDATTKELSGGMKRRCLIAKALAHGPRVLFLDEPTAGVDVDLRKDMWAIVEDLTKDGVTTILTTHYIEEAEAIADRVGIISKGNILLVEDKTALMQRMGRRQMRLVFSEPLKAVPDALKRFDLVVGPRGGLRYTYGDGAAEVGDLMAAIGETGLTLCDVETTQRSLEDIFVELVHDGDTNAEKAA